MFKLKKNKLKNINKKNIIEIFMFKYLNNNIYLIK